MLRIITNSIYRIEEEIKVYSFRPLKTEIHLTGRIPLSNAEVILLAMNSGLFLGSRLDVLTVPVDSCRYV